MFLFSLETVITGISGCPFLGNIRKVLAVLLSTMLVPSLSLKEREPAWNFPDKGWTRVVSWSRNASIEFIAETCSPLPLNDRASCRFTEAFTSTPLIPRTLKLLPVPLVEVMVSGAILMFNLSRAMSMLSAGELKRILSLTMLPFRSAFAKLYMSACDIFTLPLRLADNVPSAVIPLVSGRKVARESTAALRIASTSKRGSSPRISSAAALALNERP